MWPQIFDIVKFFLPFIDFTPTDETQLVIKISARANLVWHGRSIYQEVFRNRCKFTFPLENGKSGVLREFGNSFQLWYNFLNLLWTGLLYSNTQTCFIMKNENQIKAKPMIFKDIFVSIDLAWWCWKKMPTLLYFVWYCSTNLTARLVCRNALWRWLMKTILHETCELISVNKYKFTFTYCSRYQHYWKLSTKFHKENIYSATDL